MCNEWSFSEQKAEHQNPLTKVNNNKKTACEKCVKGHSVSGTYPYKKNSYILTLISFWII